MANAKPTIEEFQQRFTNARRREAATFQCESCTERFTSEAKWWLHVQDVHKEALSNLASEEAIADYRATKREECRIKTRVKTEQPAESHNPGQSPATRGGRPVKGGLTKKLEVLQLGKQLTEDTENKEAEGGEEDIAVGETPPSPIKIPGANRQAAQTELINRRSRNTPAKLQSAGRGAGGVGNSATTGRRGKVQTTDPDYDRYGPDNPEAPRPKGQLYDPSQPAKPSNDSGKRLDNVTPGQDSNISQGPGRAQPATRGRKENKKVKGRGDRLPAATQAPLEPQVKTIILRNVGHDQVQPQQAQQYTQITTPIFKTEVGDSSISAEDASLQMVRQPETRPISGDQLLSEVKGIYAGLVMVEAKCVEVDGKQAAQAKAMEVEGLKPARLTNEQWQALIALHRTLLHEHHDFFLASQHPSSSAALRRLAAKYAMPARMWRHGIHGFLELLRHRLPHSLEHMLSFIYLAYSIMALLLETVPAFEETWIECLGDLGRYRMAIEDDDIRDREVWTTVARSWYSKAADKKPTVGRLYHHIAILARPNVLQQLFYYCKSLTVGQPFASARESILSLFEPMLSNNSTVSRSQPVDAIFVTLHATWFTHTDLDRFEGVLYEFLSPLDKHISKVGDKWTVQGCLIAVCNIAALFQYNSPTSKLRQAWKEGTVSVKEEEVEDASTTNIGEATSNEVDGLLPPLPREASSEHATPLLVVTSGKAQGVDQESKASVAAAIKQEAEEQHTWLALEYAIKMSFSILDLVLQRIDDNHVLPHIHTWMVFLLHISKSTPAMRLIEQDFPFENLAVLLNSLIKGESGSLNQVDSTINYELDEFPKRQGRPLPEDWTLRGLEFTKNYLPAGWIEDAKVDDEERLLELPSFLAARKQRILWLGYMIAKAGDWLSYDSQTKEFSMHSGMIERKFNQETVQIKKREESVPPIKKEEDSDVEMENIPFPEDNVDEFEDLEQSEDLQQLRALKLKQLALKTLKTQLKLEHTVEEEQETNLEATRRISARDALRPNYTVLVVDTNFMLSSLDMFRLMVSDNGWSVVIPNTVLTELNGLFSSPTVSSAAREAVTAIQASITAKKDLRIITAKGNNVTNMTNVGFYKEKLEEHPEGTESIDDVIIAITEAQGKLRAEMMRANGNDPGLAQPAVLVTDDRNMRVKATAKQVPAISGSALKTVLHPRPKRKPVNVPSSPIASLHKTFPHLSEETLLNALHEANMNVEAAELSLYASSIAANGGKPVNSNKKRPKREQGRTAGAG